MRKPAIGSSQCCRSRSAAFGPHDDAHPLLINLVRLLARAAAHDATAANQMASRPSDTDHLDGSDAQASTNSGHRK